MKKEVTIDTLAEDIHTLKDSMEKQSIKMDAHFHVVDDRFKYMDRRFENMDEQFQKIDVRFEKIDERFKKIDVRFEKIDERFKKIDVRFEKIDERFESMDEKIENLTIMSKLGFDDQSEQIQENKRGIDRLSELIISFGDDLAKFLKMQEAEHAAHYLRFDRIEKHIGLK